MQLVLAILAGVAWVSFANFVYLQELHSSAGGIDGHVQNAKNFYHGTKNLVKGAHKIKGAVKDLYNEYGNEIR